MRDCLPLRLRALPGDAVGFTEWLSVRFTSTSVVVSGDPEERLLTSYQYTILNLDTFSAMLHNSGGIGRVEHIPK